MRFQQVAAKALVRELADRSEARAAALELRDLSEMKDIRSELEAVSASNRALAKEIASLRRGSKSHAGMEDEKDDVPLIDGYRVDQMSPAAAALLSAASAQAAALNATVDSTDAPEDGDEEDANDDQDVSDESENDRQWDGMDVDELRKALRKAQAEQKALKHFKADAEKADAARRASEASLEMDEEALEAAQA
jgi:hypothetical protein